MKVEVTDEHIIRGVRGHCQRCPVALAVENAMEAAGHDTCGLLVSVMADELIVNSWGKDYYLDLPPDVRTAVQLYDGGFGMQPFSFDVPLDRPTAPTEPTP